MPRFTRSLSSCLDSAEVEDTADDDENFARDGGRVGGIFLGGNHLGDKGVERVVDGMGDSCREYYKLYLCENRIGHVGASIISCSLKHNSTLVELSLGNNHIGDKGAQEIAASLAVNDSLEMLDLERNNIGPSGISALAQALESQNSSLQWLVLSKNPIGDVGANMILQCIGNSISLHHLQRCNHSLLSVVLKKVTQVKVTTTLGKIRHYLKINRMSISSPTLAAQLKILFHVKENPCYLLKYLSKRRRDDTNTEECGCMALILSLLGKHRDLSSMFVLLKNSTSLFSDEPMIPKSEVMCGN